MPPLGHAEHLDLQAFDRGVDVARGAGARNLLAEDMPGLDRLAQLDRHTVIVDATETRKAELDEGIEPFEREPIPESVQLADDVAQVGGDEMRQHPAIV